MAQTVLIISRRGRLLQELRTRLGSGDGAPVLEAASGRHALELARILQPEVIVADAEHEFVARRAMSLVAESGRGVKLLVLSADGAEMQARTLGPRTSATWGRLRAAIQEEPPAAPAARGRTGKALPSSGTLVSN